MYKVALVTTCRDRRAHVEKTLPLNLQNLSAESQVILVDYGSPDKLSRYIRSEHRRDLNKGRLVYYSMPDRTSFHMAHAKNVAHRCGILEGADLLVNTDADNWTGPGFSDWVRDKFDEADSNSEAIFLGARKNHRGSGHLAYVRTPRGCFGRIGCSSQAFRHAGGYDEIFEHWSPDDKDYGMRLGNLGYNWHMIRPVFLNALQHGANSNNPWEIARRAQGSGDDEECILSTRAKLGVVNFGRFGCGVVYRNFCPEPIELKPIPTRVFGIGMHRTGTTSLADAFKKLGFDSAHWVSGHWAKHIYDEMKSLGRSPTLEMHYALCDLPIPLFWRELDHAYPGSKFVLTERPEDDWVESVRTHWKLRASWDNDVFSNIAHRETYGTPDFDENLFREVYRRHNAEVKAYFRDRPQDLLVVDVSKARMPELCRFFGVPIFDAPFPHKHKSAFQEKYKQTVGP